MFQLLNKFKEKYTGWFVTLVLTGSLFLGIGASEVLTGCRGGPARKAHNTELTVATSAKGALLAWGGYVTKAKADIAKRRDAGESIATTQPALNELNKKDRAVQSAYLKYQVSMRLAIQVTKDALSATNALSGFDVAVAAVHAAEDALIEIVAKSIK